MKESGWLVINDSREKVVYSTDAFGKAWYTDDPAKAEFFVDRKAASLRRTMLMSYSWRVVPVVRERGKGGVNGSAQLER